MRLPWLQYNNSSNKDWVIEGNHSSREGKWVCCNPKFIDTIAQNLRYEKFISKVVNLKFKILPSDSNKNISFKTNKKPQSNH
ncbi:hypothetical protein VNO77_25116 [Canavalia gladiata]|uniref:Uncharacterized protein n=1 Tax=Canavalia gladiata TaxID=3824 RepID=A0AAN9L7I9_CANGL